MGMSSRVGAVLVLAMAASTAAGCQMSKSSNPLAPSVAGPIAGVTITTPNLLEPGQDWQIRLRDQPVKLMIQNADTSGVRTLNYTFEVAADSAFSSIVFKRTGVSAGNVTTTLQLPDALPAGRTYWWRARAEDGANVGSYSKVVSFVAVAPVELGVPTAASPSGTISTTVPEFKVNAGSKSGPFEHIVYAVQVANDQAFSSIAWTTVVDESGAETTIAQNYSFLNNRTYFWRVQTKDLSDSQAVSSWSGVQVFTTAQAAPPSGGSGGGGPAGGGDWESCGSTPREAIVQCVRSAVYRQSTLENAFDITKRVAWLLRGKGYGLLIKDGGENIISWRGYSFSISRICLPNGNIVKILTDAGPGGTNGASWDDSLYVSPGLYVPAINPDLP
ncbi:MAG: hypothetical protein EXQ55_04850 [Acidobacteria bacterium]|nr:hypothetical protein [Acidobacteriota bacterium]